ncbi:Mitochondria-eating protein C-terminal domain [Trinorchestia longiramus]|nr:Mitochondria-eating protein C-terminal domain [Trinorchestia longiramus]
MDFFREPPWSNKLPVFLQNARVLLQTSVLPFQRRTRNNFLQFSRSRSFKISKSFRYIVPPERSYWYDGSEFHADESLVETLQGNQELLDGDETPPPPYDAVASSGNSYMRPKVSRIRNQSPHRNLVPLRKAPAVPSGLSHTGRRSHLRARRGKRSANRAKCENKCGLTRRTNPINGGNYFGSIRKNAKCHLLNFKGNPSSRDRNFTNCDNSATDEVMFITEKKNTAASKDISSAAYKTYSNAFKNLSNRSHCSSRKMKPKLDEDEEIIQKSSSSRGSLGCRKSERFCEKKSGKICFDSASKIKENSSSCKNETSENNDFIPFLEPVTLKGGSELFPPSVCSPQASDVLFLMEDSPGKLLCQRPSNEPFSRKSLSEESGVLFRNSEEVFRRDNHFLKEGNLHNAVKCCPNMSFKLHMNYFGQENNCLATNKELQVNFDTRDPDDKKPCVTIKKDILNERKRFGVASENIFTAENTCLNCESYSGHKVIQCETDGKLFERSQSRVQNDQIFSEGSNKDFGLYRSPSSRCILNSGSAYGADDSKVRVSDYNASHFDDQKALLSRNFSRIDSRNNNSQLARPFFCIEFSPQSRVRASAENWKSDGIQGTNEAYSRNSLGDEFSVHFDGTEKEENTRKQKVFEKEYSGTQIFDGNQIESDEEGETNNEMDLLCSRNSPADDSVREYFDCLALSGGISGIAMRDRSRVGTRMTLPMPSSSLSSSAVSSSQTSSGPSCSSSAVGSDTQSQRGSDGGQAHEVGSKGESPAPTVTQHPDDVASVLKAPSEAPSGVSTLADVEDVGSKAELEALRRELTQARQTIRLMHEREKDYKERLNERASRISGEPPARVRITSPIRPVPRQDTSCTKNSNSCLGGDRMRHNSDDCGLKGEISTCSPEKIFFRREEAPRRDFGRSKSVVDLVEESSTCPHVNKSWAQTYSREYPKGYVNNGSKLRPQSPRKNQFGDASSVVAVVGPRPKSAYHSTATSPKASEEKGSCSSDAKRLSAVMRNSSCDSSKQMSAALEANLTGRLENLALGDKRPSALVRRYANLYAQTRVETLDALDQLTEMRNASELKSKLLFSVVVLAFRSVTAASSALRQDVRKILQVPPSGGNPQSTDNPAFPSSGTSVFHKSKPTHPDSHVALANSVKGLTTGADLSALEAAMATVITANVDTHDLTQNVEDVCQQIWATLYDYPSLKKCEGLLRYVKECVRIAWGLVNQSPPYCIEYEARTYSDDLHVRFHTSDLEFDSVRTYLWPALREVLELLLQHWNCCSSTGIAAPALELLLQHWNCSSSIGIAATVLELLLQC